MDATRPLTRRGRKRSIDIASAPHSDSRRARRHRRRRAMTTTDAARRRAPSWPRVTTGGVHHARPRTSAPGGHGGRPWTSRASPFPRECRERGRYFSEDSDEGRSLRSRRSAGKPRTWRAGSQPNAGRERRPDGGWLPKTRTSRAAGGGFEGEFGEGFAFTRPLQDRPEGVQRGSRSASLPTRMRERSNSARRSTLSGL